MGAESNKQHGTKALHIADVESSFKFKVTGYMYGKKVWVFTENKRLAEKIQLDAECNSIVSIIYEWTDDGWI